MVHIHTESAQHDFTASAMIVRYENTIPKVLLVRHKKYDKYIQPGGHVELLENPWQAVMHEILEETGYSFSQLKIMQPKDQLRTLDDGGVIHPLPAFVNTHPIPTDHFHTDSIYIFLTEDLASQKPGDDESQDLIWVSQTELNEIPAAELFADTRQMFNHAFDHYLATWDVLDVAVYDSKNPHV